MASCYDTILVCFRTICPSWCKSTVTAQQSQCEPYISTAAAKPLVIKDQLGALSAINVTIRMIVGRCYGKRNMYNLCVELFIVVL